MHECEAWLRSDDDPELHGVPSVKLWPQLVDEPSIIFGKKLNGAEYRK